MYLLNVVVMNAEGTFKRMKFIVDDTTRWYDIRAFICNDGGNLYYLYFNQQVVNDTDYVMPLVEKIDDMGMMVYASTDRHEYLKRMKHKPKRINYRTNINVIPYQDQDIVESF